MNKIVLEYQRPDETISDYYDRLCAMKREFYRVKFKGEQPKEGIDRDYIAEVSGSIQKVNKEMRSIKQRTRERMAEGKSLEDFESVVDDITKNETILSSKNETLRAMGEGSMNMSLRADMNNFNILTKRVEYVQAVKELKEDYTPEKKAEFLALYELTEEALEKDLAFSIQELDELMAKQVKIIEQSTLKGMTSLMDVLKKTDKIYEVMKNKKKMSRYTKEFKKSNSKIFRKQRTTESLRNLDFSDSISKQICKLLVQSDDKVSAKYKKVHDLKLRMREDVANKRRDSISFTSKLSVVIANMMIVYYIEYLTSSKINKEYRRKFIMVFDDVFWIDEKLYFIEQML